MREPYSPSVCWISRKLRALDTMTFTETTSRTDEQVKNYINSNYFPAANSSEMAQLMTLYPSDVTLGSPFDTGTSNVLTPQFKRLAALQGDLAFQGPRRFFLAQVSGKQNTWSFRGLHP